MKCEADEDFVKEKIDGQTVEDSVTSSNDDKSLVKSGKK